MTLLNYTELRLKWHMVCDIYFTTTTHEKKGIHELQRHADLGKEEVFIISNNQYRA